MCNKISTGRKNKKLPAAFPIHELITIFFELSTQTIKKFKPISAKSSLYIFSNTRPPINCKMPKLHTHFREKHFKFYSFQSFSFLQKRYSAYILDSKSKSFAVLSLPSKMKNHSLLLQVILSLRICWYILPVLCRRTQDNSAFSDVYRKSRNFQYI